MYQLLVLWACACAALAADVPGQCDSGAEKPLGPKEEDTEVWYPYESIGADPASECPTMGVRIDDGILVFDRDFGEEKAQKPLNDTDHDEGRTLLRPTLLFTVKKSDWHQYTLLDKDSAVLYLCKQITSTTKRILAWKFSKTSKVSEEVREANNAVASRYPELTTTTWRDQRHCEPYPWLF